MSEKTIEKAIIQKVTELGGFIKKIEPKSNTGNKGYPDLTGVINGRYLGIEVKKTTGGKPTPVQLRTLQKIANAGGIAIITNDINIVTKLHRLSLSSDKITISQDDIVIDYVSDIKDDISVAQAHKLWSQTPNIHTLQILKSKK